MRFFVSLVVILFSAAGVAAQEAGGVWRPQPGVRNISRSDFGLAMNGASIVDLGLVSDERIGLEQEDDSFGRGPKILMFRTPRPLSMREGQAVRFRVLTGEIDAVSVRPESYPGKVKWSFTISEVIGAGGRRVLYSDEIPIGGSQHVSLGWYSELEIEVSLLGREVRAARPLWIAVEPAGVFESGTDRPLDERSSEREPGSAGEQQ